MEKNEQLWHVPKRLRWASGGVLLFSVTRGAVFIYMRLTMAFDSLLLWLILVCSVTIVLVLQGLKYQIRAKGPVCIHCGYNLNGLPDNYTCPECGLPYVFSDCIAYQKDPNRFRREHERTMWLRRNGDKSET